VESYTISPGKKEEKSCLLLICQRRQNGGISLAREEEKRGGKEVHVVYPQGGGNASHTFLTEERHWGSFAVVQSGRMQGREKIFRKKQREGGSVVDGTDKAERGPFFHKKKVREADT